MPNRYAVRMATIEDYNDAGLDGLHKVIADPGYVVIDTVTGFRECDPMPRLTAERICALMESSPSSDYELLFD